MEERCILGRERVFWLQNHGRRCAEAAGGFSPRKLCSPQRYLARGGFTWPGSRLAWVYGVAWGCHGLDWVCLTWLGYSVAWPGYGVAWLGYGVAWLGMVWSGWAPMRAMNNLKILGFAQNFEIVHGPHGCPARPHHTQPGHGKPRPGHAIPKSGHAKARPGHGKLRPSHAKARPGHAKTQAKPHQT